jgi:hypothetical protein
MSKTIEVNKERVWGVVEVATKAVAYNIRELHPLEAIIGFAEVVGRAIAAQDVSGVGHEELMKIAREHIERTVRASYQSKGQNSSIIQTVQ